MTLSERLKQLLEKKGDNVKDAANRTRVAYATMHGLVNGASDNPQRGTLEKIAHAYDVSVSWLLGEEGDGAEQEGGKGSAEETPEQAVAQSEEDRLVESLIHTVRMAGGAQDLPPEERRRVQLDVVEGMIRLYAAEGRDTARLRAVRESLEKGQADGSEGTALAPPPNRGGLLPPVEQAGRAADGADPRRLLWHRLDAIDSDPALTATQKLVKREQELAAFRMGTQDEETRAAGVRARALDRESLIAAGRAVELSGGLAYDIREATEEERRHHAAREQSRREEEEATRRAAS